MRVYTFRFTAAQLKKLPAKQRGIAIAAAQCVNELLSVALFTILEQKSKGKTEAELALITLRQMTILRFQVSKIVEFHRLITRWLGLLRKQNPELHAEAVELLKPITRAIAAAPWSYELRDKTSFHYDADYAEKSLEELPNNTELNFMAGAIQSANAFNFADQIFSTPILVRAGGGNLADGISAVQDFALELQQPIIEFTAWLIPTLFSKAGIKFVSESGKIKSSLCADRRTKPIPLLFARKKDQKKKA